MPVKVEAWTWTLMVSDGGVAVELLRDGEHKLTLPLDPMQVEILMDKPLSLYSVLTDDQGSDL